MPTRHLAITCALATLLACTHSVHAQEAPTPAEVARAVEAPSQPPRRVGRVRAWRGVRIALGTLAGGGAAVGTTLLIAAAADGHWSGPIFMIPAVSVTSASAVQLFAWTLGSRGSIGWTFAGAGAATFALAPVYLTSIVCIDELGAYCDSRAHNLYETALLVATLAGPTIGAIIANTISSDDNDAAACEDAMTVMPIATPTEDAHGILLGAVGTF